ncbi:pentapeptide repeat-containing protein [Nostoc sp. DSM 114167]|uniref:pentapeptide repeat-containing protein n=1 Tax=Nostoc sp. DSM 114167 TaxID=3439050 RepID=UPI0040454754
MLDYANFTAANLINAALMYCDATKVNFTYASMGGVGIETAFTKSNFSNADLSDGSFYRLIIEECRL